MVLIMKNGQKPVPDKESNYLMQVQTRRKDRSDCGWRKRTSVETKCRAAAGRQVFLQPHLSNSAGGTTSDTGDVVKQKHLSTSTYIMKRGRWYMFAGESFIADEAIPELEPGSEFSLDPVSTSGEDLSSFQSRNKSILLFTLVLGGEAWGH